MSRAAFYCASSELFFLGAVSLINSLRIHGHREPIFVLDCGLTPAHRELLATEATLVNPPADLSPHLLKTVAPLRHPAETMVLIDVDMIVTRPLGPLVELAAPGRVAAVENEVERFVPEWGDLLGLGPIERRSYVSSGLVALGGATGREVLDLWDSKQRLVDYERSWFARDEQDYPFRFIDQDVLNAILSSRDPEGVVVLERRLAPTPPFQGVRLRDASAVRCEYADGIEPFVLHHFHRKPWVIPVYHGLYSRLLSRLWLEPDLAIPLEPAEIPLRFRRGALARVERARVDVADVLIRRVLGRLGSR